MKSLNEAIAELNSKDFDLKFEARMVQSRIISTILDVIQEKNLTQTDLERDTGLSQPFISALLNINKKLSMEHIALFQKALGITLQPPIPLSSDMHHKKFYESVDYSDFNAYESVSYNSPEFNIVYSQFEDSGYHKRNSTKKNIVLKIA